MEPVAFVNELWLARHRPPHKGTILKRFILALTRWLELQQVLSCKLFVSFGSKNLNR